MASVAMFTAVSKWSSSMSLEEAVGAELKACRRRKQISQEQLGFDAGVHRTYVSLIERGASLHYLF